jgi:hypothetical protein
MRTSLGLRILAVVGLTGLLACASTPPSTDWEQVRIVEKNREGMEHLALPEEMEGCRYLGPVRASIPSPAMGATMSSKEVVESLKKKAAQKGGDTVAVLPGLSPPDATSVRGSVFDCGAD